MAGREDDVGIHFELYYRNLLGRRVEVRPLGSEGVSGTFLGGLVDGTGYAVEVATGTVALVKPAEGSVLTTDREAFTWLE